MLPRSNGTVRSGTPGQHPQVQQVQQQLPLSSSAKFSPFRAAETLHYESPHISHAVPRQQSQGSFSSPQPGVARTLEEVEAEMRALAQRSRENVAIPRPSSHQQQQQTQQHQLQQLQQLQQRNTPPPRMHPHSQSPRFHQQQQQVLLQQQQQLQQQLQQQQLQQLREQQQLQELQELQDYREQLQMEELERRLRAQQLYQAQQQQQQQQQQARAALHQRQPSTGPTLVEIQAAEQLLRRRQQQRSPASFVNDQLEVPFQQNAQYLPQDLQAQQRMLAEAAQLELLQQLKGTPSQIDQENLRAEAMRKIMEAERMEDKRRRRQAKVAHMVSLVSLLEYPAIKVSFSLGTMI